MLDSSCTHRSATLCDVHWLGQVLAMTTALEKQCTLLISYEKGVPILLRSSLGERRLGGSAMESTLEGPTASDANVAEAGALPGVPVALTKLPARSTAAALSRESLSRIGGIQGSALAKVERFVGNVLSAAAEAAAAATAAASNGYESGDGSEDGSTGEDGLVESVLGLGLSRIRKLAAQGAAWTVNDLRQGLESTDVADKVITLRVLILMQLNGEIPATQQGSLLMAVIRYVLPNEDNQLRKLCFIYLEIVDKTGRDGKMLPEMILVCNLLRNELIHPNEYSRGCALRLCCKLNEAELLEPLVPAIRQNLEHRHAYVRRNALLAIGAIQRRFPQLIPDAAEHIVQYLENENDQNCRRNAFLVLIQADQRHAAKYLLHHAEQLPSWSEPMQLAALELVRRFRTDELAERGTFVKLIFALLQSSNASVAFEAAQVLVRLSAAPTAVRAAVSTYCNLLVTQSDNNVKLILLDRITDLRQHFAPIIQEQLTELLRALSAPDLHVRQRVLDLVMDMIGPRNVEEVASALRKELHRLADNISAEDSASDAALNYRRMLIRAIHQSVIHYPEIAAKILGTLTDFMGDAVGLAGLDVVSFLRELGERYVEMREPVLRHLLVALPLIRAVRVFRGVLWTLCEFCAKPSEAMEAFAAISQQIGHLPLTGSGSDKALAPTELEHEDSQMAVPPIELADRAWSATPTSASASMSSTAISSKKVTNTSSRPRVLPDGTYATETADAFQGSELSLGDSSYVTLRDADALSTPALRRMLLQGDHFLWVSVMTALTKLALRLSQVRSEAADLHCTPAVCRRAMAYALLLGASLLRLGRDRLHAETVTRLDEDTAQRIQSCLQVLLQAMQGSLDALTYHVWLESSHLAFCEMLKRHRASEDAKAKARALDEQLPVEALVDFRLLQARRASSMAMNRGQRAQFATSIGALGRSGTPAAVVPATDPNVDDIELAACGDQRRRAALRDLHLRHLHALSGLSDPVYVEAQITMHQFDILLDLWLLNQTEHLLQNVCVELFTLGDLRLCERPSPLVLGPHESKQIRVALKVSSTDTGVIFGNLVFDYGRSAANSGVEDGSGCVIALHEIHLDVIEYLQPSEINEALFCSMWEEFEWENKVTIRSRLGSLDAVLALVSETLHMRCQSPRHANNKSGFLAANLYATSVFGEHVLANLSAERLADGTIQGTVRIRSKTQGLALSLGERLGQTASLVDAMV